MIQRDPDLHNAISMRPLPFSIHHNRERASQAGTPESDQHLHLHHHQDHDHDQPGTSSGISHKDQKSAEPVARPAYHRNSSDSERNDVERQTSLPEYHAEHDPFKLRQSLKDLDHEKARRKANTSAKRVCHPVGKGKDMVKSHKVLKFYGNQNDTIERLLKPVDDHVREAKEEQGAEALQFKIAVQGSFIANIILAILQVYGAVSSGSLSLFTTMADSIFDPASNLTLILCNRAVNFVDPRKWPSGKGRLETAGNIVSLSIMCAFQYMLGSLHLRPILRNWQTFCFLMTAVSFILIVESIRQLVAKQDDVSFHYPSVIAVGIAFATKLGLFLYCFALRNKYSQIRILWEDHRNDLFINGFGLMTSVLGSRVK